MASVSIGIIKKTAESLRAQRKKKRDEIQIKLITNYQSPIPHAQFPIPNPQFPNYLRNYSKADTV
jgi:hypothetical protein